ncbi:SPRY-domain-containing protein [Microstroma glucosiphilum]|uniref:SPRY-domain-containing protein n=1 Tax=Pseudomicrostroma glucosiphilum TaxID=1684307 RepID=A0A316UAL3_9BASI|nr:SPRY-domain-containing protein [Pseudomicrostroma glucosiphilum]PWN22247.1 SPRY-domain-containing protein [Pseudomicrostroma glucosiphilum]
MSLVPVSSRKWEATPPASSSSEARDVTDYSSLASSSSSSSSHSPRPLIDEALLEQSWDDIVSSRIPSRSSAKPDDRSLWQHWVQSTIDSMADEDSTFFLSSATGPSREIRQQVPALSYPQSGQGKRQRGGSSEEAASSRAMGEASRLAFKSPSQPRAYQDDRAQKQKSRSPRRRTASAPSGGSDSVPRWVQALGSQVVSSQTQQQVPFEGGPPDTLPSQTPFPPPQAPTARPMPGGGNNDSALIILLPLLVLLSTLLLVLLLFLILLIVIRRRARIALLSSDGPLDVGREEELEGTGGLEGLEDRWLETVDEPTRRGYSRAKAWLLSHPPSSTATEMTMSQLLSIQEKGVSAWSFEPDYEANSSCYVEARTEITFVADGQGMAPQEGGGCSVQSNLPLPKINEVYYWEAKIFTKPETTTISVGLATKPYPSFRLPGWSKYSVGFFSSDGFKCHNYPFAAQSYGPAYVQGDVIGIGYRPRTGTAFFTRNGKKLEDAFVGLNRYNLFPTIGANGPAEVHVNLGQAAFVVIEANVKKWGLAPMNGTLGPPPAYGQERGSILIEAGQSSSGGRMTPPPPVSPPRSEAGNSQGLQIPYGHGRRRRGNESRRGRQAINAASHQAGVMAEQEAAERDRERQEEEYSNPGRERRASTSSSISEAPLNPPTPGHLDISLHSLRGSHRMGGSNESLSPSEGNSSRSSNTLRLQMHTPPASGPPSGQDTGSYFPPTPTRRSGGGQEGPLGGITATRSVSPPPYSERTSSTLAAPPFTSRDSGNSSPSGSLGGTSESGHRARRTSGRTHRIASSVFSVLADLRGEGSGQGDLESRPARAQRNASELEYERSVSASRDRTGTSAQQQQQQQQRANTWGEALAGWWFSSPAR